MSMLLIITSIGIYRAKEGYIKSYIYDRKRQWLEKSYNEDNNIGTDTKKWRYKIWFNKRKKVKISKRGNEIITNISMILFNFILLMILRGGVLALLPIYLLINNILKLLENVFS